MKITGLQVLLMILLTLTGCKSVLTEPDIDPTASGSTGRMEPSAEFTTFNAFITSVYQTPDSLKDALVDSFLTWAATLTGIPYIEDSTAYFLYTNSSSVNVEVAGDFNGWTPNGNIFNHLSNTDLYYRAEDFEMDARLDYKLVINGNSWILDPRNSRTVSGGFGPNSEIPMPAYVQPPEIASYDIPHGSLESFVFSDTTQGRNRSVRVYLPPGYTAGTDSFRTAYFHDGGEYVSLANAVNVLDYLIHHDEIPPVIGVFVDPTDRMEEYWYDYEFMAMFMNELVPYIDSQYRTFQDPEMRAVAGVSLGGLTSLLFTLEYPEVFGNCGAFSPAVQIGDIIEQYENSATLPIKVYIDAGTYEPTIYEPALTLAEYLHLNGWDSVGYSWHEGHSWGSWRAHIDLALNYFWPYDASGIDTTWD